MWYASYENRYSYTLLPYLESCSSTTYGRCLMVIGSFQKLGNDGHVLPWALGILKIVGSMNDHRVIPGTRRPVSVVDGGR